MIGFVTGIIVAIIIILLPLEGLEPEGHRCLALSIMTVVWWAMNVAQSGYIGGVYITLLLVLNVTTTDIVFQSWYSSSTMWLVIGAYMIAGAVKDSGLGERIAYALIKRFVHSYNGIIVSVFILTLVMSLLIPHPWPRAFLVMSVMSVVIKGADIPKIDAVKIGFTVFAASVPVSLIFLTGDSVINSLAVSYVKESTIGWLSWFVYMGVPE